MPYILLSTLMIGAAAFLAGFVGPIILSPEANQGPLLGIFITGPLGLMAGAIAGVVLPWIVPERHRIRVLVVLAATTCLGILAGIAGFKGPEFVGRLYHAEFTERGQAVKLIPSAIRRWEEMAKQYPHAPKTGWQQDRTGMVQTAGGKVVGLRQAKVWFVYRERKPWSKGRHHYVAQPLEAELEAYAAQDLVMTSPGWFLALASDVPPDWPPRNPGDFLGIVEITAAPPDLRPPAE
jgi:hypothetical protein